MFIIINFLAFYILSLFALASIKNSYIRGVILLISGFFMILQIGSLYFSNSFIDYKFYVHFNVRDFMTMRDYYILPAVFLLLMLIIFSASMYLLTDLVSKLKIYAEKLYRYVTVVVLIVLMSLPGGIISNFIDVLKIVTVGDVSFEIALKNLGMDEYIYPSEVKAEKGKNIIILSLESIERGFLSEKKANLTPNLRALVKEWNYYDMKQTPGSGWTSGSLYTTLTGFPSYFKQQMNDIFQDSYDTQITGFTHVLDKAGYEMTYMIGNADFSATRDLLNTYKVTDIIDRKTLSDKYNTEGLQWGIHDKDLFEELELEIQRRKNGNQNFLLYMSTTATHSPDVLYDSRMEAFVPPQESKLDFMISAVDYMVGHLINFLKAENILENTVVYIFPDHLQFLNTTKLKDTGERSLYVITNASYHDMKYDSSKTIYQIDLPKLILAGADVSHNAKFLTDFIEGDVIDYIDDNKSEITALNSSGLKRKSLGAMEYISSLNDENKKDDRLTKKTEHFDEYAKDTYRFIAHAGGRIDGDDYTNSLEALDYNYEMGFRLFELDIIETSDSVFVAAHDWLKWAEMTELQVVPPPTEEEFLSIKLNGEYTPLNMDRINSWFTNHPDAILVTDKINKPERFAEEFVDKNRLMMELFTLDAVKEGIAADILSAMPSQSVLKELGEDKLAELMSFGVKNIAVKRSYIPKNLDFLIELKNNDIKVYVFQLNPDEGEDEEYVVNYEMDYIYGVYADEWEFE